MVQPAPRMSTAPTPNSDSICQSGRQPGSAAKAMLQVHGRYSSHVPEGGQSARLGWARRRARGAAGRAAARGPAPALPNAHAPARGRVLRRRHRAPRPSLPHRRTPAARRGRCQRRSPTRSGHGSPTRRHGYRISTAAASPWLRRRQPRSPMGWWTRMRRR